MPDEVSSPERLAYWYLRLNGFLTTENFVVHPDIGSDQRTDADLLAVRFRHRAENLQTPMEDDPRVCDADALVNVIIGEVKRGVCALNGPWTRQADKNIHRVLAAIGCLPKAEIADAADGLYARGEYVNSLVSIRLMAFGDEKGDLTPAVPQVLFDQMIAFMWKRFKQYKEQKRSVGSWSVDGRTLRDAFDRASSSEAEFSRQVRERFGLPRLGATHE